MSAPSPSAALARFVAETPTGAIPPALRNLARRSVTSALAAGIAGRRDPDAAAMLRVLTRLSGPARAGVIAGGPRLDVTRAAFANAMLCNLLDFDDTHAPTILHPTAPVLGAVMALAEDLGTAPAEAMTAFTLGCEVACRLADAVSPEHYRRGWHITATTGALGAALAAARLLGLDARQSLWALGHATAQASGTVETLGTMAKSTGVGNAAQAGVLAALMAAEGVAGPETPLEGPRGYLRLVTDRPDLEGLAQGLGQDWSFARNMPKPYPCGVVLNPVIEAALALRADLGTADISRIEIAGCQLLLDRTDRPLARLPRDLQVCAQHCVSAALLRGRFGPAEVDAEAAADPQIAALRTRVGPMVVEPVFTVDGARVTLWLEDGRTLSRTIAEAEGSPGRPLGDAALAAKLRAQCREPADAEALLTALSGIWSEVPLSALTGPGGDPA